MIGSTAASKHKEKESELHAARTPSLLSPPVKFRAGTLLCCLHFQRTSRAGEQIAGSGGLEVRDVGTCHIAACILQRPASAAWKGAWVASGSTEMSFTKLHAAAHQGIRSLQLLSITVNHRLRRIWAQRRVRQQSGRPPRRGIFRITLDKEARRDSPHAQFRQKSAKMDGLSILDK